MAGQQPSGWTHPERVNSTYLPPGWNLQRLRNATGEDLRNLDPEECSRLMAGINEACPDGVGEPDRSVPTPTLPGPLLAHFENTGLHSYEWGFVVYRATSYEDEALWQEFRRKWDLLTQQSLDQLGDNDVLNEARGNLRFSWREETRFEVCTFDEIFLDYQSHLPQFPIALQHPLCLVVTPDCLHSLLAVDIPTAAPIHRPWSTASAPYVIAVHSSGPRDEENDNDEDSDPDLSAALVPHVKHFKMAIEHVLDEALPELYDRTPWEMCPDAEEDDLWFSSVLRTKVSGG